MTKTMTKETEILFSHLAPLLGDLEDAGVDIAKIDWETVADWYGTEATRIDAEQDLMRYLDI